MMMFVVSQQLLGAVYHPLAAGAGRLGSIIQPRRLQNSSEPCCLVRKTGKIVQAFREHKEDRKVSETVKHDECPMLIIGYTLGNIIYRCLADREFDRNHRPCICGFAVWLSTS